MESPDKPNEEKNINPYNDRSQAEWDLIIKNRSITITALLLLSSIIGIIVIFWGKYIGLGFMYEYNMAILATIVIIVFLAGTGLGLYTYLQFSSTKILVALNSPNPSTPIQNALPSKTIEATPSIVPSTDAPTSDSVENPVPAETATTAATTEKNSSNAALNFNAVVINEDLQNISRRFKDETNRLAKSANVNLIFGSLNTIGAILFLAYEVFGNELNFDKDKLAQVLAHYIPRLSLVIFIEIFAFFFLRIYKANLNDIKYYHNEQTNIDQKLLALKVATNIGNEKMQSTVIEQLAKAERNLVLKKGESTVDLEKEKMEATNNKTLMDGFKSLLKLKLGE